MSDINQSIIIKLGYIYILFYNWNQNDQSNKKINILYKNALKIILNVANYNVKI